MRLSHALLALTLLASVVHAQAQTQDQAPRPARSRADEMLDSWNNIGNKLVAAAQDFPEDKYDFKVQKDERTFAQNLLHAAALDFVLIRRISGSKVGPDFGEGDNPSRDVFKTKADVVKFVQEAVADGAKVIQQQAEAGLDSTTKFFGNRLAHNSYIWMFAIEHSGEHYGQLVATTGPTIWFLPTRVGKNLEGAIHEAAMHRFVFGRSNYHHDRTGRKNGRRTSASGSAVTTGNIGGHG